MAGIGLASARHPRLRPGFGHNAATGTRHKVVRYGFRRDDFRALGQVGTNGMAFAFSGVAKLLLAAGLSASVAGCTSMGGAGPLAFGPVQAPRIGGSDAILVSLNGGLLPQETIGSLGAPDQLRALSAEYEALEKAPLGQKVAWKSPTSDASGEVFAGTPYQVGQQNCRQYTHAATIRGAAVKRQGAACRNEDGSWTPLS